MTDDSMTDEKTGARNLELAADLTIAWLGNPNVRASADEVPAFLKTIYGTLAELAGQDSTAPAGEAAPAYTPAVSPRSSVKRDHIVSLIDGKPYKTLKRHLSGHGLTPDDYRQRYGLKADYPMVAPDYSEQRRAMAKKIGLGRKPGAKPPRRKTAAKA